MKAPRDISRKQYLARMAALGFTRPVEGGFMGYWLCPDGRTQVSDWNAPDNNRARLAYMMREAERIAAREVSK